MKFSSRITIASGGLLAGLLGPHVCAQAVTLDPYQITGTVQAVSVSSQNFPTALGATSASATSATGAAQAQTVLGLTPSPSITSSGSVTNDPVNSSSSMQGDGKLTYFLEVVGAGSGPVSVSVNASGTISTSAIAAGNVGAQARTVLQVGTGTTLLINDSAIVTSQLSFLGQNVSFTHTGTGTVSGTAATGFTGGFTDTGTYQFLANTIYKVVIEALVSAGITGNPANGVCPTCIGGTENLFASVDPMFTSNDPLFHIELSADIGNSAATPLPAALPLFATGLGALGLLGWRRKRKAADFKS